MHFLVCEEEPISKNQLEVYKMVFENNNPLVLAIETFNDQLYVNYFGRKHEIKEFITMHPR